MRLSSQATNSNSIVDGLEVLVCLLFRYKFVNLIYQSLADDDERFVLLASMIFDFKILLLVTMFIRLQVNAHIILQLLMLPW